MSSVIDTNNPRKALRSATLFLCMSLGLAGGLLGQVSFAQAAEARGQYCDNDRGNACNDHEPNNSSSRPSGGPATDPAPAEPDPAPTEPEPTPETPT